MFEVGAHRHKRIDDVLGRDWIESGHTKFKQSIAASRRRRLLELGDAAGFVDYKSRFAHAKPTGQSERYAQGLSIPI